MDYREKYLKYKKKYFQLQNILYGGKQLFLNINSQPKTFNYDSTDKILKLFNFIAKNFNIKDDEINQYGFILLPKKSYGKSSQKSDIINLFDNSNDESNILNNNIIDIFTKYDDYECRKYKKENKQESERKQIDILGKNIFVKLLNYLESEHEMYDKIIVSEYSANNDTTYDNIKDNINKNIIQQFQPDIFSDVDKNIVIILYDTIFFLDISNKYQFYELIGNIKEVPIDHDEVNRNKIRKYIYNSSDLLFRPKYDIEPIYKYIDELNKTNMRTKNITFYVVNFKLENEDNIIKLFNENNIKHINAYMWTGDKIY